MAGHYALTGRVGDWANGLTIETQVEKERVEKGRSRRRLPEALPTIRVRYVEQHKKDSSALAFSAAERSLLTMSHDTRPQALVRFSFHGEGMSTAGASRSTGAYDSTALAEGGS